MNDGPSIRSPLLCPRFLWAASLLVFLYFLNSSSLLADEKSIEREKILTDVTKEIGPLVDRSLCGRFYKEYEETFERLSDAQMSASNASLAIVNEVFLLENSKPDAFVIQERVKGISKSHHYVFVTTGLVQSLFKDSDDKITIDESISGMERLAGVLAHELAHPMDVGGAESFSFRDEYSKLVASQMLETRADIEGSLILARAGYPIDGLYQALLRILTKQKSINPETLLAILKHSHPQHDLRLSVLRIFLTLHRFTFGKKKPEFPQAMVPTVIREITEFKQKQERTPFPRPKDLEDAFARLDETIENTAKSTKRLYEANWLLVELDYLLKEKGENFSDQDVDRLAKIMAALSSSGRTRIDIWSRDHFMGKQAGEDLPDSYFLGKSHFDLIPHIPLYHSPRYLEFVRKKFAELLKAQDEFETGNTEALRSLMTMLPMSVVLREFSSEIESIFFSEDRRGKTLSEFLVDFLQRHEDRPVRILPIETEAQWAGFLVSKILPKLPLEEFWEFAFETVPHFRYLAGNYRAQEFKTPAYYRMMFFLTSKHEYVKNSKRGESPRSFQPHLQRMRHEILNASDPSITEGVQQIARFMWERRGFFGTLEISYRNETLIDWETIFLLLGIEKNEGYRTIRESVVEYTTTKEYAELLEFLKEVSKQEDFDFKKTPLSWADPALLESLQGRFNPGIKSSRSLRLVAKRLFVAPLLYMYPDLIRKRYKEEFGRILSKQQTLSLDDLEEAHQKATFVLFGEKIPSLSKEFTVFLGDIQASVISEVPLSKELVTQALRVWFVDRVQEKEIYPKWLYRRKDSRNTKVLKELVSNEVYETPSEAIYEMLYLKKWRSLERHELSFQADALFMARDYLSKSLKEELAVIGHTPLSAAAKQEKIFEFIGRVIDPYYGRCGDTRLVNSKSARQLKTMILEISKTLNLTQNQKLQLFKRLTAGGPTLATDAYLKSELLEWILNLPPKEKYAELRSLLVEGRILSHNLQVDMARLYSRPTLDQMKKKGCTRVQLDSFLTELDHLVEKGGVRKDQFLEDVAWELNIENSMDLRLIEEHKSTNWRKAKPWAINFASLFGGALTNMDRDTANDLIEYLLNPEEKPFPESAKKLLQRSITAQSIQARRDIWDKLKGLLDPEALDENIVYQTIQSIEILALDSTVEERIPIFEMILNSGRDPIVTEEEYPSRIAQRFLKYPPGSTDETKLLAYLSIIPPHERSVTIAYLLATASEDKSGVSATFEAFKEAGKKAAQFGSIFELFEDQGTNVELAHFKDSAKPMTKSEIKTILKEELTEGEFSQIRSLVRVLGSASLKTVVLAELVDGRRVAIVIRDPHADDRVAMNLELGKRYVVELSRRGLQSQSALIESLISQVELELKDELNLILEAQKIDEFREMYDALNDSMEADLDGWKFEVPQVVEGFQRREKVIFLEVADGVSFNKIRNEAYAQQAGRLIVKSSLFGISDFGMGNFDWHTGNFLVNGDQKVIYPLDFGQGKHLETKPGMIRTDERLILAQFFRALNEARFSDLAEYGLRMTTAPAVSPEIQKDLSQELEQILQGKVDFNGAVLQVIEAFEKRGLHFERRFSFGLFKGLMYLYKEEYVPDGEFREFMKEMVARIYKKKVGALVWDEIKTRGVKTAIPSLVQLMRSQGVKKKKSRSGSGGAGSECVESLRTDE